jgi:ATP/maltotriose-dependent transcriptional regulator MalT
MVEALHAQGTTLAFLGRLPEARQALERIFEIAPVNQHEFHGSLYVLDPHVTSLSMLARLLTLTGELDLAMRRASESVEVANRLAHPHSLAYATFWVGWIFHARGEYEQSMTHLDSAMGLGRTHGIPLFVEWGRVMRGSALAHLGRRTEGLAEIRKSIDRQEAMGSKVERAYFYTLQAEALLGDGQCGEALHWCDEALDVTHRLGGRSFEAETHRVRGEALHALRRDDAAAVLGRARAIARAAECRLLELRAAISCVRAQPGRAESRAALRETLTGFDAAARLPLLAEARRLAQ